MVAALVNYENQQHVPNYKFGILYMKQEQKEENQFFNNISGSREFDEFLDCIGDRVALKGFQGFAGGLDTKADTTGTESIYVKHHGYEIMFHVSTLLPYFPKDPQQVERKRHLGNDVVLVVFKDSHSEPFPSHTISSQFNHIFVVIEPEQGGSMYRVSIANKFGVRPYGPLLPNPALFHKGPNFRDFLLTKLINAERAAMYAPDFRQRLAQTKDILLKNICGSFTKEKKNMIMKKVETVRMLGEKVRKASDNESIRKSTERESRKALSSSDSICIQRNESKEEVDVTN